MNERGYTTLPIVAPGESPVEPDRTTFGHEMQKLAA